MLIIWTVTNGLADDIAVEDLKRFEEELTTFAKSSHPAVLNTIREKGTIGDDLKASMKEAVEDFKATRWETAKFSIVRHAPAYQVGQKYAADHQGDENGRRGNLGVD